MPKNQIQISLKKLKLLAWVDIKGKSKTEEQAKTVHTLSYNNHSLSHNNEGLRIHEADP